MLNSIIELVHTLVNPESFKKLVFDMSKTETIDKSELYNIYANCYRYEYNEKDILFLNLSKEQKQYLRNFIACENVTIVPNLVEINQFKRVQQ